MLLLGKLHSKVSFSVLFLRTVTFPRLKGGSYEIKVCLSVYLFVCHRVKRTLLGRTLIVISFDGVRGTSMRELESDVRFCCTTMVARQPIHPDFTEMRFQGIFRRVEVESEFRLPRSASVDREPMKIDFAENTFS